MFCLRFFGFFFWFVFFLNDFCLVNFSVVVGYILGKDFLLILVILNFCL